MSVHDAPRSAVARVETAALRLALRHPDIDADALAQLASDVYAAGYDHGAGVCGDEPLPPHARAMALHRAYGVAHEHRLHVLAERFETSEGA